jgi:hypothetical protein
MKKIHMPHKNLVLLCRFACYVVGSQWRDARHVPAGQRGKVYPIVGASNYQP